MSSLEVSSYDDYEDYYDPLEDFEANRSSLQNYCNLMLREIKEECNGVLQEFLNDLSDDIKSFEHEVKDALNRYTWEAFQKSDRYSELNSMLSRRLLDIRQRIRSIKIEQEQTSMRTNQCLTVSKGILSKEFSSEVLSTYIDEIESLRREIGKTEQMHSLRDKCRAMETLVDKLQQIANLHKHAKTIDLSGMKEEKAVIKTTLQRQKDALGIIKKEVEHFYQLIKGMDQNACRSLNSLIKGLEDETHAQRVNMVRDQVKLTYGRIKEELALTMACREMLSQSHNHLVKYEGAGDLIKQVEALMARETITRKEYESLSAMVRDFILQAEQKNKAEQKKQSFVGKVEEHLKKLGYVVLDGDEKGKASDTIVQGDPIYFDTKWDNYKVLARMNDRGELTTRLVRVVLSEEEKKAKTAYQRQKDIEIAKSWCKDYDRFVQQMYEDGIRINVKVRREPEEEEILCIVNKDMAKRKRKKVQGKVQEIKQQRQ